MTTLLCDYMNSIVTSDTRWSIGGNPLDPLILSDKKTYLIYSDDTGFDKLTLLQDRFVLMTAGSANFIALWKEWWINSRDMQKRPPVVDQDNQPQIALAIVDLIDRETLFDFSLGHALYCKDENIVKAFSAGSGGIHAAQALLKCGCAKSSIEFASLNDFCTSSSYKFVCNASKENNLSTPTYDLNVIGDAIDKRGYIMELNQETATNVVKLTDHPLYDEIMLKYASGQLVPSAPAPRLQSAEWTSETNEKLYDAMNKVNELTN